jgi:hypothetical protein
MVQMSGDAHVLNFGLWATPERNLAFACATDETLPDRSSGISRHKPVLVIARGERASDGSVWTRCAPVSANTASGCAGTRRAP